MAEDVVRTAVFDVPRRLEESLQELETMIKEAKACKDIRTKLAAMGEMRKHIALVVSTLESLTRAEAVAEFEAEILEAIADERVTVRKRIMGLFEKRSEGEEPHAKAQRRKEGAEAF